MTTIKSLTSIKGARIMSRSSTAATEPMIAFHGEESNKQAILSQLHAHAAADQIVKGQYWERGKGCAIGCTLHSGDHAEYEPRFGIPQMLAHLEDRIFEGLPNARAVAWPVEFMEAITPGADLSRVGWRFLYWLLTDKAVNPGIEHPLVRAAVTGAATIVGARADGNVVAESAARSAAACAWSAESAAWSAEASAARSAAACAWNAATWAACAERGEREERAESARSAARSAAACAAWRSAAYGLMADQLLDLLRLCAVAS